MRELAVPCVVSVVGFYPGFASAAYDGAVRIWDTAKQVTALTLPAHAAAVVALATGPELLPLADRNNGVSGSLLFLVSGSLDGEVKVWDVRRPQRPLNYMCFGVELEQLCVAPSGILAGLRQKGVRAFSLADKETASVQSMPSRPNGTASAPASSRWRSGVPPS